MNIFHLIKKYESERDGQIFLLFNFLTLLLLLGVHLLYIANRAYGTILQP